MVRPGVQPGLMATGCLLLGSTGLPPGAVVPGEGTPRSCGQPASPSRQGPDSETVCLYYIAKHKKSPKCKQEKCAG